MTQQINIKLIHFWYLQILLQKLIIYVWDLLILLSCTKILGRTTQSTNFVVEELSAKIFIVSYKTFEISSKQFMQPDFLSTKPLCVAVCLTRLRSLRKTTVTLKIKDRKIEVEEK